MSRSVYSSSSENSLLKATGPFRTSTTGISLHGDKRPEPQHVTPSFVVGEVTIYGKQTVAGETVEIKTTEE